MKIDIKGVIVANDEKWMYDYYEMDAVCPKEVLEAIGKANGEQLDVYINSIGGEIGAGSEIYAALENYCGQVYIHCVGYVCSSASVIACAGESDIVKTALFMYHNVQGGAEGDYHKLDKASAILQTANKAICAAYVEKTGKSEPELLAEMDAETWLTAQEAVARGFIDRIAENKNTNIRLVAGTGLLPLKVIEQLRDTVNPTRQQACVLLPTLQAKYKYLILGGKK